MMTKKSKPICFNYAEHEQALADIEELRAEVEEYRRKYVNLLIKHRILEDNYRKLELKTGQ